MSPGPMRWSKERKVAYCKELLAGMAEGAKTGDRFVPIYLHRSHVVGCFEDAFAEQKTEDGYEVGGYGITPQELGAPESWSVSQALEYVGNLWVRYVQAAWPLHRSTPGSEKFREAEAQGNPTESLADFWKGW